MLAYSNVMGMEVDLAMAKEALKNTFKETYTQAIDVNLIKKVVCSYYNIKISDMNGKKKSRSVAFPRQIAMYLCRELIN